MSGTLHVFDFLAGTKQPAAINVVFGDEAFLKRLAKRAVRDRVVGDSEDFVGGALDGSEISWKDAHDELVTVSLFSTGGPKLVVIERADRFVTENRERLEAYAERPSSHSALLLDVETWQRTTRLFKRLDKTGLQIECKPPTKGRSGKAIDEKRVAEWLVSRAGDAHQRQLKGRAATRLVEMVGPNFGLLDQELAKLALLANEDEAIDIRLVESAVGGWRAETTWELMDAAADGNTSHALVQLDRLLQNGEHPVALFAQISWSLRRYVTATRIYEHEERQQRGRPRLSDVLVKAGFPHWNRQALARAETQLKRIGRARAGQIHHWLLDADLALKGSHSAPSRARFVLEQLIVRIGQD